MFSLFEKLSFSSKLKFICKNTLSIALFFLTCKPSFSQNQHQSTYYDIGSLVSTSGIDSNGNFSFGMEFIPRIKVYSFLKDSGVDSNWNLESKDTILDSISKKYLNYYQRSQIISVDSIMPFSDYAKLLGNSNKGIRLRVYNNLTNLVYDSRNTSEFLESNDWYLAYPIPYGYCHWIMSVDYENEAYPLEYIYGTFMILKTN